MPPSPPSPNVVPAGMVDAKGKTSILPAPPPMAALGEGDLMVEVLKEKLYFASFAKPPPPTAGIHYFSTDRSLVYWNFFLDFGPMNLGQTYRFCQMVQDKLKKFPGDRIVYYCANHGHRRANSVMLMCAFTMLVLGISADEAFRPFQHIPLVPFHDATPCACSYNLSVYDCLKGMEKARKLGFLNFETFDVDEYEHYEKVESGDLSWIFPGKFVAFAGPHDKKSHDETYPTCVPEDYVEHFLSRKVGLVVRLNKKYYDENRFRAHGIDHMDLYYPDGSCPSDEILDRFLQMCESRAQDEAIAVHCKAGLGRTGTCIGAYAMKHWGFTASEVIGWMRVARPGSVIGPQQQYLESIQDRMHGAGRLSIAMSPPRRTKSPSMVTVASKPMTTVMPMQQQDAMDVEDDDEKTQGDFLLTAKISSPHSPQHNRKSLLGVASKGGSGLLKMEFAAATETSTTVSPHAITTHTSSTASFSLRGITKKLSFGK